MKFLMCSAWLLVFGGAAMAQQPARPDEPKAPAQPASRPSTPPPADEPPRVRVNPNPTPLPRVRTNDDPYFDPSSVERKKDAFAYLGYEERRKKYEEERERALAQLERGETAKLPEMASIFLVDEVELVGVFIQNGKKVALLRPLVTNEDPFYVSEGTRFFNGVVREIFLAEPTPEARLLPPPRITLVEIPPANAKFKGVTKVLTLPKQRRLTIPEKDKEARKS
jgi:hypothetical protein